MQHFGEFVDLRLEDPKKLDVRSRILRTAIVLFNSNGVHTTGIDRIIAESGVAKMSFYKYFPSKGKLVAEYLRFKHQCWDRGMTFHTTSPEKDDTEKFLGIFDFLKAWFLEPDYKGCPFIRGLSEFDPGYEPEVLACTAQHFDSIQITVQTLLKVIRPDDYKKLTPKIMSLIAGSIVLAQATKNPGIADVNKQVAQSLIALHSS